MTWIGRSRLRSQIEPPAETTVRITSPGAPWIGYTYDPKREALVVEGVHLPERCAPIHGAVAPRAVNPDGSPLEVAVLGQVAPAGGSLGRVRAIGLLRFEDGSAALLAVLAGDPVYSRVLSPRDLPEEVIGSVLEHLGRAASVEGPDEAREHLRQATERAARAACSVHRVAPSWRAATLSGRGGGSEDASTSSERELLRLPFRFQRYVAECLSPRERILLHVSRPPMPAPGRRLLGRRKLHDAIFVLTDQQVLLLEDALPPDSTLVHWGFIARSVPPERLARVTVDAHEERCAVGLSIEAEEGTEEWVVPFPPDRRDLLYELRGMLGGFVASEGTTALRRSYSVEGDDRWRVGEGLDARELELLAHLRDDLARRLEGEGVVAEACSAGGSEGMLVAVTRKRFCTLDASGVFRQVSLGAVSTVGLQHSLIGNELRLALPRPSGVETLVVPFVGPAAADFTRLFVTLRRLIAQPFPAPGLGDGRGPTATG